jgi:hypothetical protein
MFTTVALANQAATTVARSIQSDAMVITGTEPIFRDDLRRV